MKLIKDLFRNLSKDEQGYGTIELLLIVAGLGVLATGIFSSLNTSLAGTGGAAEDVTGKIDGVITNWTTVGP